MGRTRLKRKHKFPGRSPVRDTTREEQFGASVTSGRHKRYRTGGAGWGGGEPHKHTPRKEKEGQGKVNKGCCGVRGECFSASRVPASSRSGEGPEDICQESHSGGRSGVGNYKRERKTKSSGVAHVAEARRGTSSRFAECKRAHTKKPRNCRACTKGIE